MNLRAKTDLEKSQKKERILSSLANLLERYDFQDIKMSQISEKAQIAKGSLFFYFKNKETLFMSLHFKELEKRFANFNSLIDKNKINTLLDFKRLLLVELENLLDNSPLYLKLESIRPEILETNTDLDYLLEIKKQIYKKIHKLGERVEQNIDVSYKEVIYITHVENSIILGAISNNKIPKKYENILKKENILFADNDVKAEILSTFKYFLDGYLKRN